MNRRKLIQLGAFFLANRTFLSPAASLFRQSNRQEDTQAAQPGGENQRCDLGSITPYQGPIIDAMAQTGQGLNIEEALKKAKSVGVAKMALFARIHNSEDGSSLVDRFAESHPDFIIRGAPKFFNMRGDLASLYVHEVLNGVASGRYAFVGEILYTHGDKKSGERTATGERYIDPTQPNTRRLILGLASLHVPIMTHWEVYNWERDWPLFHRLYSQFPDQIFIWPHLGFGSTEQADMVLASCPNVWATLSKREKSNENLADSVWEDKTGGSVIDICGHLMPGWRTLMMKHADRLMFATDAHQANRWAHYSKIVEKWRFILGQLPSDVVSKIAYVNAEVLYKPNYIPR
jgi:hypothetical protein